MITTVVVVVLCAVVGFVQQVKAEGLVITSLVTSQGAITTGEFHAAPAAASVGGGSTTFSYTIALEAYSSLYTPPGGASVPGFVEVFDFAGLQGGFQFTPDAGSGLSASDFLL